MNHGENPMPEAQALCPECGHSLGDWIAPHEIGCSEGRKMAIRIAHNLCPECHSSRQDHLDGCKEALAEIQGLYNSCVHWEWVRESISGNPPSADPAPVAKRSWLDKLSDWFNRG